jgi:primase-polymerase (primpol)-like protein
VNAPAPDPLLDNVPACLRERPQWVCWRYVLRKGKRTKVPFDAKTGAEASSTDPGTWATFEEALAALRSGKGYDGVGYVFAADDPYCGIDLDDAIDPATRELKSWAAEIVTLLDSYGEISPSGEGVKVWVRAEKRGDRCRKEYEDGEVEMYDHGRFFAVTGARLEDRNPEVEQRQAELETVYGWVFGAAEPAFPVAPQVSATPAPRPSAASLSDDEIVAKAERSRKGGAKFGDLWAGRWQGHFRSQSEADSSLVFTLAFYTKDAAQLDRLFRRSGLMRDKWDERHGQRRTGRSRSTRRCRPSRGSGSRGSCASRHTGRTTTRRSPTGGPTTSPSR